MNSTDIEKLCGPCQDLRACWAILGVFQVLMLCIHRYVPYPFEPVRVLKQLLFRTNVVAVPHRDNPPVAEDSFRFTRQEMSRNRRARRRRNTRLRQRRWL